MFLFDLSPSPPGLTSLEGIGSDQQLAHLKTTSLGPDSDSLC